MLIKYFICFLLILSNGLILSQETSVYKSYYLNSFYNFNPAAAGFDGALINQLSVSKKWAGITQSPTTEIISNSIRLGEEEFYDPDMFLNKPIINLANRIGIGISIYNTTSGPLRRTGALFAYAYHLPIHNYRLSFGLSASISQYSINQKEFKPLEKMDQALYNDNTALVPDFNVGIMCYDQNLFIGFSANGIYNLVEVIDHTKTNPDFILCGGYKFKIYNVLEFEPSVFLLNEELNINTVDISSKFFYRKKNWIQFSYRSSGEIISGVGVSIMRGIHFCYFISVNTNEIMQYSAGNHSIALKLNLAQLIRNKK